MAFTIEQLESAMADCLSGKTPADAVTKLANEMRPEDLKHIVAYLNNGPQPDGFFESWTRKGKKTIDGFYAMLDMFSALVYAQGQAGVDQLVPHLNAQTPFLERVLVLATDDRFVGDIVDRYLTGKPDSESETLPPELAREPVPIDHPKALQKGDVEWELSGENVLIARVEPEGEHRILQVSLSSGLSPIDGVRLYIRITDDVSPAGPPTLTPNKEWIQASLVEEIVEVDNRYWFKNAAPERDPTEEYPWTATFTTRYTPPAHNYKIQLMVVDPKEWTPDGDSTEFYNSTVLDDWWLSS